MVSDPNGGIVATASCGFEHHIQLTASASWHEQSPERWWKATVGCLVAIVRDLGQKGIQAADIAALSVDSTSGTVFPIDAGGNPLRPALMYNDSRAGAEAEEINQVADEHCRQHGYKFSSSYALAKILWLKKNEPAIFDKAHLFIHATDYIIGKLTGDFGTSDLSSALKTGCNLFHSSWPGFIESRLGIPIRKLPALVRPGTFVCNLCLTCAQETGLSLKTKAVAGATDGTAAFLSSGASQVGDFNSTLGTTLVIKGISENILTDPEGRLYSHKHPSGHWLPGGASNVGGECLAVRFADRDLAVLDRQAIQISPTDLLAYPLERGGERFPFANKDAVGFLSREPRSEEERYAALLEGVGYVERMCYDLLAGLGAKVNPTIYATGGGAKSREWLQIRADILNRPLLRPEIAESAFGSCLLAAGHSGYPSLSAATKAMVRFGEPVAPRPEKVPVYAERFAAFREECRKRGYLA